MRIGSVLIPFVIHLAVGQSSAHPAFEVASIREHQPPYRVLHEYTASGTHLTLEVYARRQLIEEAYGLKNYQIVWSPSAGKENNVFYDVIAKAEGEVPPTRDQFRQMLQTLLAQRFNLKFHYETREIPVYALTVGKNGPKFKASAPDASEEGLFGVHGRNQTIERPRESMESLAHDIPNIFMVDRPVIDRTGLEGLFDINLEATPEVRIERDPQPDDLRVFSAVQDQLGLKLDPSKATLQMFVVDHMEGPSEN